MSTDFVTPAVLREELLRWDETRDAQLQELRAEVRQLSHTLEVLAHRVAELAHPEERELPFPL